VHLKKWPELFLAQKEGTSYRYIKVLDSNVVIIKMFPESAKWL
jgi:hypothetical protein